MNRLMVGRLSLGLIVGFTSVACGDVDDATQLEVYAGTDQNLTFPTIFERTESTEFSKDKTRTLTISCATAKAPPRYVLGVKAWKGVDESNGTVDIEVVRSVPTANARGWTFTATTRGSVSGRWSFSATITCAPESDVGEYRVATSTKSQTGGGSLRVQCPSGLRPVGGGFEAFRSNGEELKPKVYLARWSSDRTAWDVGANVGTSTATLKAYAICTRADVTLASATSPSKDASERQATTSCPSGSSPLTIGWAANASHGQDVYLKHAISSGNSIAISGRRASGITGAWTLTATANCSPQ